MTSNSTAVTLKTCEQAMLAFLTLLWLRLTVCTADTTPPVLQIEDTQPFIFHALVTVRLNENGFVSCAALETATSYTPSISQMKTGTGLDGYDSASAVANTYYNLVVAVLSPATLYDLYCYAEDSFVNGFTLSQIAATRQVIATASGGDYVAPVFSYLPPNFVVESTAVTVYVQLNEDGTVWCVAREDPGCDFVGDFGYCFAQDAAGNYIDGTPALASDPRSSHARRRPSVFIEGIEKMFSTNKYPLSSLYCSP
ncbi:unnamed protein product [Symbiodinium sp. KB8]|nr:unnamed protein product [Symbiodinium sp. KB8]